MKSLIFRSAAVSFSILALSACTKKQELSKVVIQLPSVTANQSKNQTHNLKGLSALNVPTPNWGLPRPQTLAEAKCFAVVVETPEANSSTTKKCQASDPTKSLFASHFAGLAEAGASIEMNIPSGLDRKFHLLAFNADSAAECKTLPPGSLIPSSRLSAPAHLGTKKVDIVPGDNPPLELVGSFSGAVPIENCEWTAPAALVGGSLVINAGQTYTNVVGVSATPTLPFVASDAYYTQDSSCATGGTWEPFSATKTGLTLPTGDGLKHVYAKFRDSAGSVSACLAASVTLDQTLPLISAPPLNTINISNVANYSVAGTCSENGQTVTWQIGSISGTAPCTAGAFAITSANLTAANQGSLLVTLSMSDLAGNLGTTTYNVFKDTVLPTMNITNPLSAAFINLLNMNAFVVSGSCTENGQTVQINAASVTASAVCTGNLFSANLDFTAVADGPVTITTTISDVAGNSGTSIVNVVKDTIAPIATILGTPTSVTLTASTTLNISAGDVTQYRSHVALGSPSACNNIANYGPAMPVGTALIIATPTAGAYYVCVLGIDSADNRQSEATPTIASITKGPIVVSFATHQSLDSESTAFRNIAINITPNAGLAIPIEIQVQGSAMQGVHYMGFNTGVETLVIPANTSAMSFPVSIVGSSISTHEKVMSLAIRNSPSVSGVRLGISEHQLWIEDGQVTPADMTKTTIGGSHACALNQNGKIFCWGYGATGALGIGNLVDQIAPMPVDAAYNYVDISAGINSTCAVRSTGELLCWGQNNYGQLGDGTTTQRTTPTMVGSGFSTVSVGNSFACATKPNGDLVCWGNQANGRLANGTTAAGNITVPTFVSGVSSATKVSAGWDHACARNSSNQIYCWGGNAYGQLGVGNTTDSGTPQPVSVSIATDISTGLFYSCGIGSGGSAFCWGDGASGKLGNGSGASATLPVAARSGTLFDSIQAGNNTTCAREISAGDLICWGAAYNGILGDGEPKTQSYNGVTPSLPGPATHISLGLNSTVACAVSNTKPYCWGTNPYGVLGNGLMSAQPVTAVKPDPGFTKVSLGRGGCGIRATGQLMCWGPNHLNDTPRSTLGDGSLIARNSPVYIDPGTSYIEVSVGYSHSCGITSSMQLKCWGYNALGALGIGSLVDSPTPVLVGNNYAKVSVGDDSTCAIESSGSLQCWGSNSFGQVGDGTVVDRTTPVAVMAGTIFNSVDVGSGTACGITALGALYCWGRNQFGQLGNGTTVNSSSPVLRSGTWLSVSAGAHVTCGIQTGGLLFCAGRNGNAEIGQGATTPPQYTTDTQIAGVWTSVSVGSNTRSNAPGTHVCGLESGVIKCWGAAGLGQNAPALLTNSPTAMSGTYTQMWVGEAQTCAINMAGEFVCRGLSLEAQIPLGISTSRPNLLPRVRF